MKPGDLIRVNRKTGTSVRLEPRSSAMTVVVGHVECGGIGLAVSIEEQFGVQQVFALFSGPLLGWVWKDFTRVVE